jgi:hypothetical protein
LSTTWAPVMRIIRGVLAEVVVAVRVHSPAPFPLLRHDTCVRIWAQGGSETPGRADSAALDSGKGVRALPGRNTNLVGNNRGNRGGLP